MATCEVIACDSQIGSGALPTQRVASAAVALRPASGRRAGAQLKRLAEAFRDLPTPVIGRVQDGALLFDLRSLEDERGFVDQLPRLKS
jgi:L-seryl-tRNA(Ser) seleniumtransferase